MLPPVLPHAPRERIPKPMSLVVPVVRGNAEADRSEESSERARKANTRGTDGVREGRQGIFWMPATFAQVVRGKVAEEAHNYE